MINECEDKLICDFAETYHVLNYRELPLQLVVTLLFGLRENSRVKMHISNTKLTIEQIISSIMADSLQFLAWTKTKEAQKGRYDKKSILKILNGDYETENEELAVFETIEEFENYMKQFEG